MGIPEYALGFSGLNTWWLPEDTVITVLGAQGTQHVH